MEASGPKAGEVTLLQMGLGTSELNMGNPDSRENILVEVAGKQCSRFLEDVTESARKEILQNKWEWMRTAKAKLLPPWRRQMGQRRPLLLLSMIAMLEFGPEFSESK